jgi:hypothetical protein
LRKVADFVSARPLLPVAAGKHLDQFADLAALLALIARRDRMLDAVGDVIGEDLVFGAAQRGAHRRELGDDIDAIAIVLDHAREPAHLAFDPFEPLEHRRLGIGLHARYIPLRGTRFKGLGAYRIRLVIARSESDEAIHFLASRWIASLRSQ